ncbi:serine/threonine protein phosphatase [Candidatus Bathyarchaeota archaeon]|nr:serine/threonine protein phosphatase [Candidatus Bathyarchaeota archaeon]
MMNLDDLFDRSLKVKFHDFLNLIAQVNHILSMEENNVGNLRITGRLIHMPPNGETIIVGDIHGDLLSLKHILFETEFLERASRRNNIRLIFLGDYGDRGAYSPEVYYVILTLKRIFPEKIILLQGNHEGPEDLLAHPHDLPHHLRRKFGSDWLTVYTELSKLFRRFYTAVIVEGKLIMLHGGVPSDASNLDDLAFAYEKHPFERHLEEILWSDPLDDINGKYPSPRGAGYLFGEDLTLRFLEILKVKFLIRGHEAAQYGYKFNHGGKILTLFSRKGAPYFNSHAAYLILDLSRDFNAAEDLEEYIRKF